MDRLAGCRCLAHACVVTTAMLCVADPAVAASPPPAAAFGQTPDFSQVALSPDGNTIAMDRATGSGLKVVLFRAGNPQPLRVLSVGDGTRLRGLGWADARTALIDVSATVRFEGEPNPLYRWEFWRTMAANVDGGAARTLLMDESARKMVTGATLLPINPSRPGIVYMSTFDFSGTNYRAGIGSRLGNERRDSGWTGTLFEVDTSSGKGRLLERGTAYTRQWLVSPDGRALARSEWKPDLREFSVLVKDGRGWRRVLHQSGYDSLQLAGISADGRSVVAVGENGTDRSRAWALPFDGSPPSILFEDPVADVTGAISDPDTGLVVGYETGGLTPGQHWLDPARTSQQKALARAFPGRQVYVVDRSTDGEHVLAVAESPQHPPVHYLVDFGKGKADVVGEAYPGLAGAELGEVRAITYDARDGTKIPAYLTLPPGRGEENLPLVVMPHGGPEARDSGGFDWWAQFLATRGYAVLQPQFRGSTGFGRAHRLAGYGEWGGRMQDDVSDGVRHLVASGLADAKRVCIVGASYGGYAALAGAAFTPELYACAVSVNGVSDLPQMLVDVERRIGEGSDSLGYWKDHIGSPADPRVAQRSPARAAARVRAPVLLMHGVNDTVVPPTQSEAMARALAAAGKSCEYVKLPGEDHWLSSGATRTLMLETIEAFLARHL